MTEENLIQIMGTTSNSIPSITTSDNTGNGHSIQLGSKTIDLPPGVTLTKSASAGPTIVGGVGGAFTYLTETYSSEQDILSSLEIELKGAEDYILELKDRIAKLQPKKCKKRSLIKKDK